MKVIITSILIIFLHFLFNTSNQAPFEGAVYYQYKSLDSNGDKLLFPIEEEVEYYDEFHRVNRVLRGESLMMIGDKGIYLDAKDNALYEVDYTSQRINKLEITREDKIEELEFRKLNEVYFLDYLCDEFEIRYVHKMSYMNNYNPAFSPDTLTRRYFIARDLKINDPVRFAKLQGNHNTKLLDGRFAGIPLKIITRKADGSEVAIEAIRIETNGVSIFDILKKFTFEE